MPNVSSFGAQTDNAVVSGTVTDRQMIIPEVPPQGLMSVGPRQTYNFINEPWNAQTSYVFYDAVKDGKGSTYIATKPVVPAGTPLTDMNYWFKASDPNTQLNELQEIVKLYDGRISQNASAITEEVARAKAAEQAEEQRATAAEATKAPINHASEETIYGVGNEVNYGHLKLAADDTPMTNGANDGIAATPSYINANRRFAPKSMNVAFIGDSWTDGENGTSEKYGFVEAIDELNIFKNTFKYCQGGMGYIRGNDANSDFNAMADMLIKEHSIKQDVDHVFIMGGVNDLEVATDATISKAANALFQKLASAFPNAKITVAANCLYGLSYNMQKILDAPVYEAQKIGFNGVPQIGHVAKLMGDFYTQDRYHLTKNGYKQIAPYIANAICNNEPCDYITKCTLGLGDANTPLMKNVKIENTTYFYAEALSRGRVGQFFIWVGIKENAIAKITIPYNYLPISQYESATFGKNLFNIENSVYLESADITYGQTEISISLKNKASTTLLLRISSVYDMASFALYNTLVPNY